MSDHLLCGFLGFVKGPRRLLSTEPARSSWERRPWLSLLKTVNVGTTLLNVVVRGGVWPVAVSGGYE